MARYSRPFESLEELHETGLDDFRQMLEAGVTVAILGAHDYCLKNKLDSPTWLTAAARQLSYDFIKPNKPKKQGRSTGILDRYRTDIDVHYNRYCAVEEVREQQERLKADVGELRALCKRPHELLREREYLLRCVGTTWSRAFECAAILVQGTRAGGSVDAIKRSYRLVKKASRDPRQSAPQNLTAATKTPGRDQLSLFQSLHRALDSLL